MAEPLEDLNDSPAAIAAHILEDLHDIRSALAEVCRVLSRVDQTLTELAPAARRAAAMLDNPVTRYRAARRGEPADNGQRPGPGPEDTGTARRRIGRRPPRVG